MRTTYQTAGMPMMKEIKKSDPENDPKFNRQFSAWLVKSQK